MLNLIILKLDGLYQEPDDIDQKTPASAAFDLWI